MDNNQKAQVILDDVVAALEDIGYHYESEDPALRLMLIQMAAGVALATVLERQGIWKFLRTVFGAVVIRYKHRGLVDV